MQTQATTTDAVFSTDGFAIDQSHAQALAYGRFGSQYNGCGWMAAYNVLRALGLPATADGVRAALAQRLRFGGRFGTGPLRLARYLRAHGAPVRLTLRRKTAFERAQACRAGAVFYWNGAHSGAHYVAFAAAEAVAASPASATATAATAIATTLASASTAAATIATATHTTINATADTSAQHTAPPPAPRLHTLRFFNAVLGAQAHRQTLAAFCAQHCPRGPVLFFTVS